MYGVIVMRPDGEIECWLTDSVEQWSHWAHRLTDEDADFFCFS